MMNRMMLSLMAMFLLGSLAACGGKDKNKDEMPKEDTMEKPMDDNMSESAPAEDTTAAVEAPTMNIVETAASNGDFSVLVTAVKKAGLADALSGDGPFTVFAPTNAAFKALPPGALDELLMSKNQDKLASVLKFHVVSGKIMAADVKTMGAPTLEGSNAAVVADQNGVTYAGAKVVQTDIECTNGVIHVIDAVVMPPAASAMK